MKIMNELEINEWLKSHGFPALSKTALQSHFPFSARFTPSTDSGVRRALARDLNNFESNHDVLLVITAFGIWPSAQNMHLFEMIRSAMKEIRAIYETPGHLAISADEREDLEAVLCLCLYFFWDFYLIDAQAHIMVRASHDNYFVVYSLDKNVILEYESTFREFET